MAVNLYDSPAQAQFINTYVPIQFEGLYKVAEKAQKNLDEIEALQDEVISKYSTINTPSKIDKANYEARYNQIRDWTNKKLTSGESLKDPVLQSEYKSMVRRFAGDTLIRDILENAKSLKEYSKNSDPRFGDYEKNIASTFDSRTGMFDKSNIKYQSWNELGAPNFSLLKTELIGKSADGYEDLYGISEASVAKTAKETASLLEKDPSVRIRIEAEAAIDPTAVNYIKDGKLDYKAYAEDKLRSAYGELSGIHNKKASMEWDKHQLNMSLRARAASPTYTSLVRNAAKSAADNKKELLFQANVKRMGIDGSKFVWTSNTLDKVNQKISTMKPSDAGYKEVFDQKVKLESDKAYYENVARTKFEIELNRAINPNSKVKSIFKSEDVVDLQNVSIDPAAVDNWATIRYGAPGKITFGVSDTRNVRRPNISTDFEIVDPKNRGPISNSDKPANTRKVAESLNSGFKSGKFAGKLLFESTANGKLSNDARVYNTGSAFILASDVIDVIGAANTNLLLADKVVKLKKFIKKYETPDTDTENGTPSIEAEYIEIPVQTEIVESDSKQSLTGMQFNALITK